MDKIKIVSLNVRGLCEGIKRRRVFRYLKRCNADISLIQETHCTKEVEHLWTSEWGNKIVFSNGSNRARGVAILCSKKVAKCVRDIERDCNG